MEVIYGLIPMMLLFGFLVVLVFIWMAKKGYFDDMDGQASRILMDDDEAFESGQKSTSQHAEENTHDEAETSQNYTKDTKNEAPK